MIPIPKYIDPHINQGNIKTIHTCEPLNPNSEVDCGWYKHEDLTSTANAIIEKFKKLKFNSLFNLVGYNFQSETQKKAIIAYYVDAGIQLKVRNTSDQNKWLKDSFNRIMSNPDIEPLRDNVLLDVDSNSKTIASARQGLPASIVVSEEILKIYFENLPKNLIEPAIKFILAHELGHLIVESVRSEELGSFEKANSDEFYGKLKHHLLVDAVASQLTNMEIYQIKDIMKYFPNEGDFSKRIFCMDKL